MKLFIYFFLLLFIIRSASNAQAVGIGTTTPNAAGLLHVDIGASISKGVLITGTYNASATVPDLGSGSRLMFYPGKAAFRAGQASQTSWNNASVGIYSAAFGLSTIASGTGSFATGNSTTATGLLSFASGTGSNAAGPYSTAMGYFTDAPGAAAVSLGIRTVAKGAGSTVIGVYNDSILLTNPLDETSPTNPLFIIGNGSANDNRSNAMVVLKHGGVGIGTNAPDAASLLHVHTGTLGKAFLVSGQSNSGASISSLGPGKRMAFYPSRAAFRVGGAEGTEWDNSNVGSHSIAMGYGTIASDDYAIALGYRASATAENSTAMGYITEASAFGTTAMGAFTAATGEISTAMGRATIARGFSSTVIGIYNDPILASGQTSITESTPLFIIGNGAAGSLKNAMVVLKNGNVGIGTNAPGADLSINAASGATLQLQEAGVEKAFVQLSGDNLRLGAYSTNSTANVIFRLNGGDRFTIFPTGNATLTGTLTQSSDARLKTNILPIRNAMQQLMLINGYHYYWKSIQQDPALQSGVLAQELQTVFPELVKEDASGTLSVNYSGLIPYMIQAAKEQQVQIENKQRQIDELNVRLAKLEKALLQKPLQP